MIIKIDPINPSSEDLMKSADMVKAGGIIIFPTETLYGLGCKASQEKGLKKIYNIKNRSQQKPLPVMIPDISRISELVSDFPKTAELLASMYWPGPLTLVLKSAPSLSPLITCGRDSVGIRIPDHPVALNLLKYVNEPMVVTSANISGEKDILTINEIIASFEKEADIILDAGPLSYGIPSTVVDVTKTPPVILREGKISSKEIFNTICRTGNEE